MSERLENSMNVGIPKIKNGSKVSVGKLYTVTFNIDHHFIVNKNLVKNPMNVGFLFHCIKKIDTRILQVLICKKQIKTIKEELYYVKRKSQRKGKEWS